MESPDTAPSCLNCEAPVPGRYCQACGQEARSTVITVRDYLRDAAEELFSLDGKVLRTLRVLLFSPGRLTTEYLAGRRARYVSPLRLYLLASVAFFTLQAAFDNDGPIGHHAPEPALFSQHPHKPAAPPGHLKHAPGWVQRIDETTHDDRASGRYIGVVTRWAPTTAFALVPVFAWLLRRAFRRMNPFYATHLTVALHLHALLLFFLAAGEPIDWLIVGVTRTQLSAASVGLAGAQLLASLGGGLVTIRRVYGLRWPATLWRVAAVATAQAIVVALVVIVELFVAAARAAT
jgi:hypothetical protein